MRLLFILALCCITYSGFSQIPNFDKGTRVGDDQEQESQLGEVKSNKIAPFERPAVDTYKIISIQNDTTTVDTSLTIEKEYKFNYLRRDTYELLPFGNTGQSYNRLAYDFKKSGTMPLSMAQARHYNYLGVEDIFYYYVPTPLTELYFKTAFEQGQQLDAFFTMNTSKRFNFSIAYKGVRSLGKYQNVLTSSGNFRFGFNYSTKNDRYVVRAHWVAQDLLNQENGGLQEQAVEQFISGDDQFDDRSRLLVQFQDAENILDGTRVYVNQYYKLIKKTDSLKTSGLRIGHVFNSENKFYEYRQGAAAESFLGTAFESGSFRDRTDHEEWYNEVNVRYDNPLLGSFTIQGNLTQYDYGYNSVLLQNGNSPNETERIPNRLQGSIVAVGGRYAHTIGAFDLSGDAQLNVGGDFEGYSIVGKAGYDVPKIGRLEAALYSNARAANYNHLLFQSNYLNYNWHNAPSYETVKTNTLSLALKSNTWLNASVTLSTINDYAYFAQVPSTGLVRSFQTANTLNYLNVTGQRTFRYGKFALNTQVTVQQVSGATGVLNVPDVLGRASFFYTDRVFKNALFLQTGFNAKYFTEYAMNGYDPVLAEFFVQNAQEFGAFPLLDFFINVKVRQTRIFLKAEHFNSSFTGNDFFSAPGYPYRDFNIRFGLVWNFFL